VRTAKTLTFVALAASLAAITATAASAAPIAGVPSERGDYLVTAGKRVVWASWLRKPSSTPATEPSRNTDYLTVGGKRTVLAPSLTAADRTVSRTSCRDYLVTVGKRAVWASSLPAAGTAEGIVSVCCARNSACPMDTSRCPV
jgi:hypothetical protein